MSSKEWDITPKEGPGGAGDVTEEEKNSIINKAISKWKEMGLSMEEIALGIATMNVESGFNPLAENPDPKSSAKGLGQFNDLTWPDAVKYYNRHRAKGEPKIDPDSSRWDTDDQIKVMGPWLEHVYHEAVKYSLDPRLAGYSISEIAYGLWHEGVSKTNDKVDKVKKFLDGDFSKTWIKESFKDTYNTVWGDQLTEQDDAADGTLEQDDEDYGRGWRVEPDGDE
ncbi:MAG: hypothetical protein HY884_00750 [Deltaproteobacteria bacterium]|nr:hypothetical protein [Deltaproteobacteria bacterium]